MLVGVKGLSVCKKSEIVITSTLAIMICGPIVESTAAEGKTSTCPLRAMFGDFRVGDKEIIKDLGRRCGIKKGLGEGVGAISEYSRTARETFSIVHNDLCSWPLLICIGVCEIELSNLSVDLLTVGRGRYWLRHRTPWNVYRRGWWSSRLRFSYGVIILDP